MATLAGGLLGIALAIPLRNAAATLAINGTQSFVADLAPSTLWTLAAVAVVTVLGAGMAWWQAFRDDTGALGASRERAEKPVTAWRATTLVVGLVIFAGSAWLAMSVPEAANIAGLTLIAGFALVAFGVVIAGPWLTRAAAQVFGRLTASASGVVAAGRLRRHPRSTFRSVAGLVVAVFLVSALAGVVSSITRLSTAEESQGMLSLDAVLAYTDADHAQAMEEAARATDGVQHVSVGYTPADMETIGVVMSREDAAAIGASDLPDADYVTVNLYAMLEATTFSADAEAPVPVAADGIDGLEPATVLAVTDGSQPSIERARTSLDVAGDRSISPTTRRDFAAAGATDIMQEPVRAGLRGHGHRRGDLGAVARGGDHLGGAGTQADVRIAAAGGHARGASAGHGGHRGRGAAGIDAAGLRGAGLLGGLDPGHRARQRAGVRVARWPVLGDAAGLRGVGGGGRGGLVWGGAPLHGDRVHAFRVGAGTTKAPGVSRGLRAWGG
nr:hypothetical protein [Demequina litorisediminis]